MGAGANVRELGVGACVDVLVARINTDEEIAGVEIVDFIERGS